MKIREATIEDDERVQAFLEQINADSDNNDWLKPDGLYLCEVEEKLVGIGRSFRNPLHLLVPKISILVRPDFRRKGVGTALHEIIRRTTLRDNDLGIDGSCYSQDDCAVSFMKRLGYKLYLQCSIIQFDLNYRRFVPDISTDVSFTQLSKIPDQYAQVLNFLHEGYTLNHRLNPVTILLDDKAWKKIALGDADSRLCTVMFKQDQLVGIALSAPVDMNMIELVWVFVKPIALENERNAFVNLLNEQFRLSQLYGYSRGSMEIDSVDQNLSSLQDWIKPTKKRIWQRFRM